MAEVDTEKFAAAFMGSFPDHLEGVDKSDMTHPQGLLGVDMNSTGICELWNKYEPQVEKLLGFAKFFGYGGVAAFIQAILTAVKTMIIPQICGTAAATAEPTLKSNVSQKAR